MAKSHKSPAKKVPSKNVSGKKGRKSLLKKVQLPLNPPKIHRVKQPPVQLNCGYCNKRLSNQDKHDNFMKKCKCCGTDVIVKSTCAQKIYYKAKSTGPDWTPPPTVSQVMFRLLHVDFYCKLCQHKCFYCNTNHTGTFIQYLILIAIFTKNNH